MIKIENTQVFGWEAAVRGARNPMNSWEKSDTKFIINEDEGDYQYYTLRSEMGIDDDDLGYIDGWSEEGEHCYEGGAIIGPADHKLLMNLCKGGTEESKWRRMVHVQMDVTAPLYWWKEFDTYRVGTVSNSCSTMHKIHAKEFTLDDFSHEHLNSEELEHLESAIWLLNGDRELYLESKSKQDWWQLIQLLPSSYNQKRTIDLNYEVLASQYRQRKDHKLDEWHQYCGWIKTLPYSEFITMEE